MECKHRKTIEVMSYFRKEGHKCGKLENKSVCNYGYMPTGFACELLPECSDFCKSRCQIYAEQLKEGVDKKEAEEKKVVESAEVCIYFKEGWCFKNTLHQQYYCDNCNSKKSDSKKRNADKDEQVQGEVPKDCKEYAKYGVKVSCEKMKFAIDSVKDFCKDCEPEKNNHDKDKIKELERCQYSVIRENGTMLIECCVKCGKYYLAKMSF